MRIAVIGGGIAGVSAAYLLSREHEVVLFESAAELGAHATGRSAATLSETSGLRAVCALARASRSWLEQPDPGFTDYPLTGPRGLLWIGRTGDETMLDEVAATAATGVSPTARRLDATTVRERWPALRFDAVTAGAVWEPDALALDVAGLLAGYAAGARRHGAEIVRGCEIGSLDAVDHGWSIEGWANGAAVRYDVDAVVNAAGAWADVVAERASVAPLGLQPLKRTACLVPAPPEVASWPLVMDVAGRCYFEPESGGLLLSPADEHPSAPLDAVAEPEDVAWSLEMLAETTTLDVRHVRRAWAGLRTFAPDRVPVVGWDPVAPGFFWLAGQGGAGIKTAPAMSAAATSIIGGGAWPEALSALDVGPADLAPARFGQDAGRSR